MLAAPIESVAESLKAAGLVLSLTADGRLKVAPASAMNQTLRDTIRGHRDDLVAYLQRMAANDATPPDPAPSTDPDGWCWPHSQAMNTVEIDTFMARLGRFTDKGVSHDEAERLADALVSRDREGDDRRLCLECAHLQGAGRWRCGNWQQADVARDALARDLVLMLQRCAGFAALGPHQPSEGPKP